MIEHGEIVAVSEEWLGDELAQDAPIGSVVLHVRDASDFIERGGGAVTGSESTPYTSADLDADTIALAAPTTVLHHAEDLVRVDPPVKRHVAHVQVDGAAGEVVLANLRHALKMHMRLGTYDQGAGVPCEISNDSGTWEVVNVLGVPAGLVGGSLDIPDVGEVGFHVNALGQFAAGGVDATHGLIIGDAVNGLLTLYNVVISPTVGGAIPLIVRDSFLTGGPWTEWRSSDDEVWARVTRAGVFLSGLGFALQYGNSNLVGNPNALSIESDTGDNPVIRFLGTGSAGFRNINTNQIRLDAGGLAPGGQADLEWGSGSGNGYSRLDGNDFVALAKRTTRPNREVDKVLIYFFDTGVGSPSTKEVTARGPNTGDVVLATVT